MMGWLGPMMRMIYAPRHDAHAAALAGLLTEQRAAVEDIGATRRRLEARASRGSAIDSIAEDRG